MEEMLYTIPLGEVYEKPRKRRAPKAIKEIYSFVKRHAKVNPKFIKISNSLNSLIWSRSIEKPPRKVKVKVVKEEVYTYVLLPEEKIEDVKPKAKEEVEEEKKGEEGKKEEKKEVKEKKQESAKDSGGKKESNNKEAKKSERDKLSEKSKKEREKEKQKK